MKELEMEKGAKEREKRLLLLKQKKKIESIE